MARDHLTLLHTNADPDPATRIANHGLPPGYATDYPLRMNFGRELLRAVVEDNLAAMEINMPKMPKEHRAELERYRAQTQTFFEWLGRYPDVNVWCSVRPEAPIVER